MQMKWDDSGWYKWNESEMKYISQVKEPEEDIGDIGATCWQTQEIKDYKAYPR